MKQRNHVGFLTKPMVDIWRAPSNKDLSGWRGPAVVTYVNHDQGNVAVRWQGRSMVCQFPGIRRHMFFFFLIASASVASPAMKYVIDKAEKLDAARELCMEV